MSAKGFSLGHNSGDTYVDPGPAADYVDRGPIAQYPQFDRVAVSAFYNAIRSQGDDTTRHRAIDLAFERARENAALSAQALRIFHRIGQNCHGSYRYSTEPHERLAAYCSFASPTNFHRYIREILDLGFMARFLFHRHGGGHPYPIYTVVCTADDRSGLTSQLLRRKALARRVSPTVPKAIIDDEQGIDLASIRQSDELQTIEIESIRQRDVSQNVGVTYRDGNSSERRVAIRQNDDPNLRTIISDNITTVGKEERSGEEVASPSAQRAPNILHIELAQQGATADATSNAPTDVETVEPAAIPLKPVKAAKRKRAPTGKRPWEWVHENEKRALFERCKTYAVDRSWTPDFLSERLRAFNQFQTSRRIASADWWAELELWLGNPTHQPRGMRSTRRSATDIADDVFSYQD